MSFREPPNSDVTHCNYNSKSYNKASCGPAQQQQQHILSNTTMQKELSPKDIINLYTNNADTSVIDHYYNENALFEDGTVKLEGRENIKKVFRATSLLIRSMATSNVDITMKEDKIIIDRIVTTEYKYVPLVRPAKRVITVLTLHEGLVIKHEDLWSLAHVVSDVPVMGYIYDNLFKPSLGMLAERVGQVLQFKDERQARRAQSSGINAY